MSPRTHSTRTSGTPAQGSRTSGTRAPGTPARGTPAHGTRPHGRAFTRARRAVVTGLGVIAPNGVGTDAFWKATREGISFLDRLTRPGSEHFPVRVAGQIRGFDPATMIEERLLVQTDRFTHVALAAADLALEDSRLPVDDLSPFAVGVVTAAGSGGGEFGQRELQQLYGKGPRHVGPFQSIAWFYAASTGQVSIRGGFKGPCGVLANDEAGGLDALAHARRSIRHGADAVVVGATEAGLAPYSMVCQLGWRELSRAREAGRAYLPFTADACGFVPGEGGAMFVVEEEGAARRRGVPIRGFISGHGATFTGASRWERSREGLARAIRVALEDADCAPEEIDVVFADALGVPEADRAEALAIADALGEHGTRIPVTAPKTGFGRAHCAAPVLDVAAAVLAMEHRMVPPTPYVTDVCHDLDLVTRSPRPAELRCALVLSRGLMGYNAALVLRGPEGDM